MFKGLGNMVSVMRQAREFGAQMQSVTERLKSQRATASTGAGMIEVEVNGLGEVLRVKIDPGLVARGEREMIEDLIPAAVNQAVTKARQLHMDAFKSAAAGMDLPGLNEALGQMDDEDHGAES
jgi:nucleoid-associated protein EbfC